MKINHVDICSSWLTMCWVSCIAVFMDRCLGMNESVQSFFDGLLLYDFVWSCCYMNGLMTKSLLCALSSVCVEDTSIPLLLLGVPCRFVNI